MQSFRQKKLTHHVVMCAIYYIDARVVRDSRRAAGVSANEISGHRVAERVLPGDIDTATIATNHIALA